MKIEIISMGKMRDANLKALYEEYAGRLKHYLPLEEIELREARVGRQPLDVGLLEEAEAMEKAMSSGAVAVALTEEGKTMTSAGFAQWLEQLMLAGTRHVAFCIGSAHGLDPQFKASCQRRISLSPMTFPHEMARMMLAEQLYRAMTIIRGEPYHK